MTLNRQKIIIFVYFMSFFSGTAALIYEVVWFRSLSLIFGGAHLAVTTTVSVFMLGLALGSWLAGKKLSGSDNLLRIYGILEIGIAVFGAFFLLMIKIYPHLYVPLAMHAPESIIYLTVLRVIFSLLAMLIPTTLMGATLPVLAAFTARNNQTLAVHVSYLYGFNTVGAVVGAFLTGFWLLRILPVNSVSFVAMAVNITLGVISITVLGRAYNPALDEKISPVENTRARSGKRKQKAGKGKSKTRKDTPLEVVTPFSYRVALWAIGISGFCALGYEVLWTRVLVLFLGATTYSFTILLSAFLLGIGLGGLSFALFREGMNRLRPGHRPSITNIITGLGITQLLIGISTLAAMHLIFDLPAYAISVHRFFYAISEEVFSARQAGNFVLAFTFMLVPAFFMGLAVPLSTRVIGDFRHSTGKAVGDLIAVNTLGSILGAAVSGYALIYLMGIERSLQVLCVVNIGLGLVVMSAPGNRKKFAFTISLVTVIMVSFLAIDQSTFKLWDKRYLATYSINRAPVYADEGALQKLLRENEILYYGEGAEAIVSGYRSKDTQMLTFVTNGRTEASTTLEDVQNQYMLGHLPMLLHPDPRNALVVGLGSGMTLGAVLSHPDIDNVTLAEIEPKVFGVARVFRDWNHDALNDPDLNVVINDGRNFLLTSDEKFDVITADPIHPTWRGAGYLYTHEYFELAADHLAPGGIMAQWVPLYQMSTEHVQSVIKTFMESFPYVTAWLTLADVQLLGSNEPFEIDQHDLLERMQDPTIRSDLQLAMMDTPRKLFSYFLFGTAGAEDFCDDAVLNRDSNVFLEFSSPTTIGDNTIESRNVLAMSSFRENVEHYLLSLPNENADARRERFWKKAMRFNKLADKGQAWFLGTPPPEAKREELKEKLDNIPEIGRWNSIITSLFGTAADEGSS